jgi:thymidine phosphorylase
MNQPIGNYIGNWLEVYESLLILRGENKNDLYELCIKLAGAMIFLGKKAKTQENGEAIAKDLIKNGKAYQKFIEIIKAQGGDASYIKNPGKYQKPSYKKIIRSPLNGYLKSINTFELGMCAVELGAGRMKKDDKIDPTAGIIFNYKIGDKIKKGDVIAEIFSNDKKDILNVEKKFIKLVGFSDKKIDPPKLIKTIIKGK